MLGRDWPIAYFCFSTLCDRGVYLTPTPHRLHIPTSSHEPKRRLDAAAQEKSAALAESSREASKAATTARERISRLEAEHSLSLRENGKVSVRQRALERELARIKSRCAARTYVRSAKSLCCGFWESGRRGQALVTCPDEGKAKEIRMHGHGIYRGRR